MTVRTLVIGRLWLGFCRAQHCVLFGFAIYPFKPQVNIGFACPRYLPLLIVKVQR